MKLALIGPEARAGDQWGRAGAEVVRSPVRSRGFWTLLDVR